VFENAYAPRDRFVQRELGLIHAYHKSGLSLQEGDGLAAHQSVRCQAVTAGGRLAFDAVDLRRVTRVEIRERPGQSAVLRLILSWLALHIFVSTIR
jgi:hypothetical protein